MPSHALETYEWDAAGNRTAIERTDLGTGALERTELAYDDDDRLVEAAGPEGRTTYSYDAAGNLVEKSAPGEDPVQYAWAAENRLVAVRQGGRVLMAATYDGDGNRVFQASLYRTNETAVGEEEFSWLEPRSLMLPRGLRCSFSRMNSAAGGTPVLSFGLGVGPGLYVRDDPDQLPLVLEVPVVDRQARQDNRVFCCDPMKSL